ncbi:MAG: hypothetical protein ACOYVJ_05165 [Nitrospirota bacterium]
MKREKLKGIAVAGLVFLLCSGFVFRASAEASNVDFHIGIGIGVPPPPPPHIRVVSPPRVHLIPQTPVYYAPYLEAPILFYSGYWYLPSDGYWFRASSYSGPWRYISPWKVPVVVRDIPRHAYFRDHKHRVHHEKRFVPYGQQKKHWEKWEREKNRRHYY